MAGTGLARIKVSRAWAYSGSLRSLGVYVDGVAVDSLDHGQTHVIELEAGTHTLQTHVDWMTSPLLTLQLAAGDEVTIDADVGQAWRWFLTPSRSLGLRRRSGTTSEV